MSIHSRITRGIGYGALAIATFGLLVPDQQPAIQQKAGFGGGYFQRETTAIPKKNRVEVHEDMLLAKLQAEDELVLSIIMAAVTQELIT